VGERALFLQADCEYKLFRETGFPPFDQVERAYQKAVGAFPDSADTGRALLRMGIANYEGGNSDKARGYLNLVLNEHPKSQEAVEAKVTLARLFLDENRPKPAIRLLRETISQSPQSPHVKSALWYLGRVLFEIGRYVESDQRLALILKRWPEFIYQEPMILYYLGETSFRLDRLDDARRYLYWLLNISPETANQDLVLTRLGETYRLKGDLKRAAALYTESRRLFPDSDGGLIAQIRLAETRNQKVALGKPAELDKVLGIEVSKDAEKTYRRIIKNHPERSVGQLAMLKLGALQYQRGNFQQSFETLKTLLSTYPGTEFFRDAAFALRQSFDQRMNQLAANKDTFKLIDFYQSFDENLPQELKVRYAPLLGQAYLDLKLYGRAKEFFVEASKKGTKDPKVMLGLALALFHESEYAPAEKAMARFLKSFPAHGLANRIRLDRGLALLALKRPEEALKSFLEVREKGLDGPEYWPAVEQAGRTLLKLGRTQESAELLGGVLAKAPPKFPERFGLELLLGEALLVSGDPRVAAGVLAKALQGRPVTGEFLGAYYLTAQARIKAGMMDQAKETLTQIVQSPDPFWSKLAADRLMVAELKNRMALREAEVSE
jgi:TolA-binding protein